MRPGEEQRRQTEASDMGRKRELLSSEGTWKTVTQEILERD